MKNKKFIITKKSPIPIGGVLSFMVIIIFVVLLFSVIIDLS